MIYLILAILLAVTGLGPGLWVLRRCQWEGLEKLCASIGLSFLMFFLCSWIGAINGYLPATVALWVLVALGLSIAARKEIISLVKRDQVRAALLAWAGLLLWGLLLQSIVRHYGGADWSGDWYEHYQRALYFTMWPLDRSFLFIDRYLLPARPPLMNILAAGVMSQLGSSFPLYQVLCTILNSLIFLSIVALARSLTPLKTTPWILAVFFALSPLFCQNVTYTWTRLFTGFFIVIGLTLYLKGWRLKDSTRMIAAFSFLAAGMITHYSAGPYLAVLATHYLVVVWWRQAHRWRELLLIILSGCLILGLWFGWSFRTFGMTATLASNTSVTESEKLTPVQNLAKIGRNVERTLIPFPFFQTLPEDQQRYAPGVILRDISFLLYQNNLIIAMGSLNWIVVFVLLFRGFKQRSPADKAPRAFWVTFIVATVLLGIGVHGGPSKWGLAHICLQPLILMAVAFLGLHFAELKLPLKALVVLGLLVDFLLGIAFHFHLLHSNIAPGLGTITTFNWLIKQRVGLVFLGDTLGPGGDWLQILMFIGGLAMIGSLILLGKRQPYSPVTPSHLESPEAGN